MSRLLPLALLLVACTHHTVPQPAPQPAPQPRPVPGATGYVWNTTKTMVRANLDHHVTNVYTVAHEVPRVVRPGIQAGSVSWGSQRLAVCAHHLNATGWSGQIDSIVYEGGRTVIYASAHNTGGGEVGLLSSLVVYAQLPNDGTPVEVRWR